MDTKQTVHRRNSYSLLNRLCFAVFFILPAMTFGQKRTFVHPGILHKKSDLDRMKYMVQAKVDPWYATYQIILADERSSCAYEIQGDPSWTSLSREHPCHHCKEYEGDVWAALLNAKLWYITGDTCHAEKAVEILNTWSNLTSFFGGDGADREIFYGQGTEPLSAGIFGAPLINAAEIIKSTYDGWDKADINNFKAMLVHPGYSNTTVPTEDIANDNVTFYWRCYMFDPARHGNQELAPARTLMAIGIFLDNEIIYDRALRYVKGLPHRPDDLPYEPGPRVPTSIKSKREHSISYNYKVETSIEDYGYEGVITNYIYENGQCQESSRDQTHSLMGIAFACEMAEMAWNQGDNLYAWANNRLLLGLEYTLRYNLSYEKSYPDQLVPWEPTGPDDFLQKQTRSACWKALKIRPSARGNRTIRRPALEMPLNHYLMRMNIPDDSLKWLKRSRDWSIEKNGYEQDGWNLQNPGWGGLTYRRPVNCQGDPVDRFINERPVLGVNIFPGTLELENYDVFPLSAGGGEGKTFHDLSKGNNGGAYRSEGDVDIEFTPGGGYHLTDLEPGEWVNYTVFIPEDGKYVIDVQYAAGNGNGKIKFSFDGEDKTGEVPIPYGNSNSSGWQDWKDYSVASDVALNGGVQSMRIHILGTGKAFQLNHITLTKI